MTSWNSRWWMGRDGSGWVGGSGDPTGRPSEGQDDMT